MGTQLAMDKETKQRCFLQYTAELQKEDSLITCTDLESVRKVLHKVHYQTNYTDLQGRPIQIPNSVRCKFINTMTLRWQLWNINILIKDNRVEVTPDDS